MKTAEVKTTASPNRHSPFFDKGIGGSGFFDKAVEPDRFFMKPAVSPIQAKLNFGKPDDPYEKEADAVADKVVQRLSTTDANSNQDHLRSEGSSPHVNELVQEKCAECENEEKPQLKEEPIIDSNTVFSFQRKPVFESAEVVKEDQQTMFKPDEHEDLPDSDSILQRSENTELHQSGVDVQTGVNESSNLLSSSIVSASTIQPKCENCEKEEELDKEEGPNLQKKSTFDRPEGSLNKEAEFNAGRSWEEEQADKVILFKLEPSIQMSAAGATDEYSMRNKIEETAREELGKPEAKRSDSTGRRIGYERLLEYFRLAAPDEWPDEVIEFSKYGEKHFPHWCGIFSVNVIKKAGIDVGDWKKGTGVSQFNTLEQTDSPQKGDIGYIDQPYQHHSIITEASGDSVKSIDGNSGPESGVKERDRPYDQYSGFFTAFTGSERYIQKKEETEQNTENAFQNKLDDSKKSGSKLDAITKSQMESTIGADFSGVNIHTNSDAVEMNKGLNAQAFTHGNDIYFNESKYNPQSSSGKHLLAHELTHTVQQGASKPSLQKTDDGETKKPPYKVDKIELDPTAKKIIVPLLAIPAFKKRNKALYDAHEMKSTKDRRHSERKTEEEKLWKDGVREPLKQKLESKLQNAPFVQPTGSTKKIYYLRPKNKNREFRVLGTLSELQTQLMIPYFDRSQETRLHSPDHIVEYQLNGADLFTNLELLDATANMSAGAKLQNSIKKQIIETLGELKKKLGDNVEVPIPTYEQVYADYDYIFLEASYSFTDLKGDPKKYWNQTEIKTGKHVDSLDVMNAQEIEKENLRGQPTELVIYPLRGSGVPLLIKNWDPQQKLKMGPIKNWLPNFVLDEVYYEPTGDEGKKQGLITGRFFEKGKDLPIEHDKPLTIEILKMSGVEYGGYLNQVDFVEKSLKHALKFKPLSPIDIYEATIDSARGLVAKGKILPSVPIISKADIDIVISGGDVFLQKTFSTSEIELPGIFKKTNSVLSITYGGKGLGFSGQVDFEIENVGEGYIKGDANFEGFAVAGGFNFDSKYFDPAQIEVKYKKPLDKEGEQSKGEWEINGKLGLKKSVKGVKSADLEIKYENNTINGLGNIELDVPGVESGKLAATYNTESGAFEITTELQLRKDIPGLNGGCLSVTIARDGSTGEYTLGIVGSAQPNIPGFKGTNLCIAFKEGVFTIEGVADFEKGIASGKVKIGVTNRLVKDGQPGGSIGKNLTAYGNGTLTVIFSKFLKGTIGAKITPEGRLILSGKIEIPDEIPLTRNKTDVNKKWDFPRVEFPIPGLGISILGKNVGVIVYITGGINTYASLSPIMLKQFELGLEEFDPAQPEKAVIKGSTEIGVDATAGLKVTVTAGALLSLLIAKVGGELDGSLGLELKAAAGAKAAVQWTQPKGLEFIEAYAKADSTAQMFVELGGRLYVDLDLLLKTINLWEHELFRIRKTFGPQLNFGVKVPMKIENGEFAGIDFDNITFDLPNFKDEKEREKMLTNAIDESRKPPKSNPPGKEEVMRTIKRLQPKASEGLNPFTFYTERYNYIFMLKHKYPEQDWSFIEKELPFIENDEFFYFRIDLFDFNTKIPGWTLVNTRLYLVDVFDKNHKYVDKSLIPILKQEVRDVGEKGSGNFS